VVNNYLAGLEGDDARSAIALTNGLRDSPLNGYFQVKDVVVAFNTLVDNKWSIAVGAGAGKKNTLPPQDCLFANNIVVSNKGPLVHTLAAPIRLKWEGNLMYGADVGISTTDGFRVTDPMFAQGDRGLWRPRDGSPARGAAVGDFPFVEDDIDGQPRTGPRDVGCEQHSSAPIVHRPLTPSDVGPTWRHAVGPGRGDH
jgi:poly(beta-D-mannuronate) lyase